MTLNHQPSDVGSGDSSPRLAATETPVLASQHVFQSTPQHGERPNGLYNESMSDAIPSPDQKRWGALIAEWKWIAAMLAPFGFGLALYLIPATKGELESIKSDGAAKLELANAKTAGELRAVDARLSALQTTITDTKSDVKEMRGDLKELLKRSDPRQYDPPQIVAASPAAPPENPPPSRRVKKKSVQPVAAKPASGFRLW